MATLLEEGMCIIKDKKVAERFLKDLKTSQGMGWKEIKDRAERAKKKLEEGEKWLMEMKL
jgi:bifunctional pyridoxal-dependent enzyme with beta-cystathionase and maltose regulon repressor activities